MSDNNNKHGISHTIVAESNKKLIEIMKKLNFLFLVIVFAFGMNANAQDIAIVDNSSTLEKYSDNDNIISPEIEKLKTEFVNSAKEFIPKYTKYNPKKLKAICLAKGEYRVYGYVEFLSQKNEKVIFRASKRNNKSVGGFIEVGYISVRSGYEIIFKK